MDEKQFGQLLAAIEGLGERLSTIEKDIANIKENSLTKDEGLAVSNTLVQIALESAAENATTVEDKAEAGYTILSSLLAELGNRIIDRFNQQDKQAQAIIKSQQKTYDLFSRMVEKDEK